MKQFAKPLLGAAAATALAVASASPAQASDIDGGDILAGVLIAGAAAAVIAALDNGHDDSRSVDYRYGNTGYGNTGYGNTGYGYNNGYHQINANQAVRLCATAAQQQASRYGNARVTNITDVDRNRNGFEVEGRLVVNQASYNNGRYGYNNGRYTPSSYNRDSGRFSCDIRNGRVTDIDIKGI